MSGIISGVTSDGKPKDIAVDNDGNLLTGVAAGANVDLGAKDDAAATTDTGSYSLIALIKRLLQQWTTGLRVGGSKASATNTLTRPADTTAYTALDAVGTSLAVTGATNASPIVLTTGTHNLADGDPVTVASVGGNTAANGNYFAKVTGQSSTTFALYSDKDLTTPVAGNGAYTSGGTVAKLLRFRDLARIVGGSGYLVKAQLFTNQKTCTARFKLHLFNTAVSAYLDNAAYGTLDTNKSMRTGEFTFPALGTEDSTASDQAKAILTPGNDNFPLSYIANASDDDLYGMLQTLDAFTPASGQVFYIRISVDND